MSDYPGAIDYPAHSTNVLNPPANVPKGWVLHTPEEPADGYAGTPVWFARPNVGGSTHYFVSYLGFVFQCVAENVGAIANGVTPGKNYPVFATNFVSLNRQTLSVEIEGYAATIANTISPAQKTALLNLIRHRCQAHGIPLDRQHIIGHYEVANNRSDPGTLDIDALVAELQEDDMFGDKDREKLVDIHEWMEWQRNIAGLEQRFIETEAGHWYAVYFDLKAGTVSRHYIPNKRTFALLGGNPDGSDRAQVTEAEKAKYPEGAPVPSVE